MALIYVGGNTGTWAGATSGNNTVSLTALTGGASSSAAAGDFVIAVYATGSAADRALAITDGTNNYTLIGSELYANGTSYDANLRVAYKRLTGADASVTFGPTGSVQDAGAAAVHVWRNVDSTNPLDVSAVTATGTATGRPDAESISPTTSGTVVIVAGGGAAATGATYTASELSNFRTATSADNNDAMVGVGSYAWTSGAFNPAQWTGGTTNAADSWAAVTIALRVQQPVAQTKTATLGGAVKDSYSKTATLGANIVTPQSRTATLDGAVRVTNAATASVGGAVKAAQSRTPGLDAAIRDSHTAAASLGGAVSQTNSATASLSAAVRAALSATATLGAALQQAHAANAVLDAQIQAAAAVTATASIGAAIRAAGSAESSLSGAIAAAQQAATSLDAAVSLPRQRTAGMDAIVATAFSASASLDAAILHAASANASLSGFVFAGTPRTHGAGLDAAILAARSATAGLSAALLHGAAATTGIDAAVAAPRTESATLGGLVAVQMQASASLSAAIRATHAAAASLSAYIEATSTITQRESEMLTDIWQRFGLDPAAPLTETAAAAIFGDVTLAKSGTTAIVSTRSGQSVSADPSRMIVDIWRRLGLDADHPMTAAADSITAGSLVQTIAPAPGGVIVTRIDPPYYAPPGYAVTDYTENQE